MLRSSLIAASSVILCATASAQQGATAQQVPGAVKNAGIYHLATGTWTRAASSGANLGTDVIYNNNAGSGYFSTLGSAGAVGDYTLIDEGRVPTLGSSIAGATNTEYCVNGLQFGYCSSIVGPNVAIQFDIYESYAPCELITAPVAPQILAGSIAGSGLPGGTTAGALCWVVTLDAEGVSEFFLEGDGGSAFPGEDLDVVTDSMGIAWNFIGAAGTDTGPLLNGDPDWTAAAVGAINWGGGGTYYLAETACASTGLDTQDFFAVDGANSPLNPGCYFFGGYKNTNGCGGPSNNPFGSFQTSLIGDNAATVCESSTDPGTPFCDPAGVNADGNMANLTASVDGAAGSGITLNSSGGTVGQAGIVIVSANAGAQVAISNGFLCLQGFGRYNANAGATGNSLGVYDANGDFSALGGNGDANGLGFRVPTALPSPPGGAIMGGQTWNFQLWYRDVPAMGTFNFSNGVSVTF